MRRAKIVATLGPKTRDAPSVRALIEAGVDVFRLNLAHENFDAHRSAALAVREQGRETNKVVGVLTDLPGPKMRTGPVIDDSVVLETGAGFTLTPEELEGDERRVSTSVADLARLVSEGDEIFLADGAIVLRVTSVQDGDVHTEVVRRGLLRSRKGIHVPGSEGQVEFFGHADRAALEFALSIGADFVGLSFVRNGDDVATVLDALPKRGPKPNLVAKIETRSAVGSLDEIVERADVVMVARGDLGIQTPLPRVPMLQKQIIRACNAAGTPVITATQMLESMTQSPLPTRAEIADVANAVLDGTDALMLSEETAVGEHPVEAVRLMAETIEATGPTPVYAPEAADVKDDRVSWAVAHAGVQAALDLDVAAILCPTRGGATPRRVAAFRPPMPIVGLSSRSETLGALTMVWGVIPLAMEDLPEASTAGEDVERVVSAARAAGLVTADDLVAVVAGSPGRRAGRTDYVRIVRA
ncbi:MAG: pyruvate kinase [Actinomycetota bacterium]